MQKEEIVDPVETVKNFCTIQLQILREQEQIIRKQLLDVKIQTEFLRDVLTKLERGAGG